MNKTGTESAPGALENAQWTLIRGARQLLTLRGESGPRRGSAMSDLNIITDGAVLIRDGVIVDIGTSRRVENLVPARGAREFDASGKVVMPAFVDPDIALASPGDAGNTVDDAIEADIRLMSRRRLETQAMATVADVVRYGVLTVGAHTLSAPDLKNTLKILRLHQAMQSKPLRIRSVFAPPSDAGDASDKRALDLRGLWGLRNEPETGSRTSDLRGLWALGNSGAGIGKRATDTGVLRAFSDSRATDTGVLRALEAGNHRRRVREIWMPSIFRKKLASLMEIAVDPGHIEEARTMASAAAAAGFNIRFRVSGPTNADILELACSAGAVSLICKVPTIGDTTRTLDDVACVKVILGTRMLAGDCAFKRSAIDDGIPVALASGYRRDCTASLNPQFLLFMACHILRMTVEEAIVASTYNAACSLRLSHVTGSLAPGKAADICVMDVDDYHELARRAGHHDVSLAMRAGKVVYRRQSLTLD
jgi:imidazolonepropionase